MIPVLRALRLARLPGRLRRFRTLFSAGLAVLIGGVAARAQVCSENPNLPPALGSPSGCDLCLHSLLAGALEPHPVTSHYVLSDLPEKLLATGVLYATVPVMPADRNGYPNLDMRTQITAGGFTTIDDDFDVLVWHTTEPTGGSAPRRIVVYARNEGTGSVQVTPRQIMLTDGGYTTKAALLGERVLDDNWDTLVAPVNIAPGTGEVLAYGKRFAASSNNSDASTGADCFGRVRAAVSNADPLNHPTNLRLYVVAIDGAAASQNKSRTEALLTTGATNGDPFDLNTPPSGCANRRATGVFDTFTWRSTPLTLDVNDLPADGLRFRMALGEINSQTCPLGRQTADLVLRPGYVRPDTVGNYMVDYRVTLRLINASPALTRTVDVLFGQSGASIGLAWQAAVAAQAAPDGTVDALPVHTGWAGTGQAVAERSFLESDGGPVVLEPCGERVVTLHFLILGGSSLPFEIAVQPVALAEVVVDNEDANCTRVGTWPTSANSGYWGTNSLIHLGDGGASSVTWTPGLPHDGWYSAYAWWVVSGNRAHQAPYTINHLFGSATVYMNQTDLGTMQRWNHLGDYRFATGSAGSIRLTSAVPSNEYVSADAVRLVYLGPAADIPGDLDGDGDADLADYAVFQACLEGTGGCNPAQYARADADADGNIDLRDFAAFQAALTP